MWEPNGKSWLEHQQYQTILRLTHTIAFEFEPKTGAHFVSPFISETLAGNYDDRQLSQVMLEDGVLHPDDLSRMTEFRDYILAGEIGNETIIMRLKTKAGKFRWYRISICISTVGDDGDEHQRVVGTISDIDTETRLRERQRRQMQYDELTGIYNKTAFFARTQELLKEHPDSGYSLVLTDIDRFKMVNDLFGIREGDQLLRFIGTIVATAVGGDEAYGRIRDDVFCLCVHRTDDEIVQLVEELRQGISRFPISYNLILSAGIYRIDDVSLPISIMCDRASLALRKVKGGSRMDMAFYKPELGLALAQEQKILSELQSGIRNQEFEVYYQPKHNVGDGTSIGAEALVRWNHPQSGIVLPSQFIGLLEKNGMIIYLDEYVWDKVCGALRDWIDMGLEPQPVSVNVSRVHLYDPNLCDKFVRLIEKYNIPSRLLGIELTESAYVDNPHLGKIMRALQSEGFTFLMDDFGSGYSSLNMLRSIPVDILKLDLHFLGFTDESPSGRIIMESVIQMAQRLHIPIIAEGVETAQQAAFLLEVGCTMAQGYYYSRPMPRTDYERKYLQK